MAMKLSLPNGQLPIITFNGELHTYSTNLYCRFTDERIAREDFVAMKPTLPNGQLPILTFNGTVISQSITMARYYWLFH